MKYDFFIKELKKKGSVLGLQNIRNLLDELGNPQEDLKIVHIAGTNGKGSIFAYLAAIMQEEGLKVGRYISPTIQCYEERFQINGAFISETDLEQMYEAVYLATRNLEAKELPGPTLFEAETAIAFLYFKKKHVDYALIECGMGGLTDATNVILHPVLSVIASISFDHMAFLGNTLTEIAFQKAGIIKEGVPVVVAPNVSEVTQVMKEMAEKKHAECILCEYNDYHILEERYDGMTFAMGENVYETRLPGLVQAPNAATAILAARRLHLCEQAIHEGILHTRWPGRLELLSQRPLIYRDGAHNPDAAKQLSLFLKHQFSNRRITFCLGILKDKDFTEMLSYLVPLASRIITFTPQNARGLDGKILADTIRHMQIDLEISTTETVNEAIKLARSEAVEDDVIIICGSLSFMEEMQEL